MKFIARLQRRGTVPARPKARHIIWSWAGAATGIGIIAYLAELSEQPLLMAPIGASAVLAFGVPDSPLAQPRNIIGGHIVAAAVGLIFLTLFGNAWWVMGLAVATATASMQICRVAHPPAGANPIVILTIDAGWDYLMVPVGLSAVLIAIIALLANKLTPDRQYPLYW